jgi:ParB family chromosome partitioning protein
MRIQLTSIHDDPGNSRKIKTTAEQDAALRASLQTLGQLQPVLIEPSPFESGHWDLRAGHRRLAAARDLGWDTIEAVEIEHTTDGTGERSPVAVSAAENMVRAAMHPVDQWRAVAELMADGCYNLETAAAALGIPLALARRMEHLGSMAPALIDAIGTGDLPQANYLRVIALAPHEVQIKALDKAKRKSAKGEYIDWYTLSELCTLRRIPQSRAIFDTSLLAWDEDLFAEPTDGDRFSTTDIDAFLALQEIALNKQAAASKDRIEIIKEGKRPSGWYSTGDDVPKRWRKLDPRRVFASVITQGYYIGQVQYDVCAPHDNTRESDKRHVSGATIIEPIKARDPISKVVQKQLAAMKTEATRDYLLAYSKGEANPGAMLELLLLCFTLRNVSAGPIAGSPWGELAKLLIDSEGRTRALDDGALCEIAGQIIGQIIRFDAPDDARGSGPGAEWIARAIAVEMPRTDTPEILKGISGDKLAEIAQEHGIKPQKTVGDLRKAMVGKLPDWRAVEFGAEGPRSGDDPMFAEVDDAPDSVKAAMNDDPDVPDAVASAWEPDDVDDAA